MNVPLETIITVVGGAAGLLLTVWMIKNDQIKTQSAEREKIYVKIENVESSLCAKIDELQKSYVQKEDLRDVLIEIRKSVADITTTLMTFKERCATCKGGYKGPHDGS